MAFWDGWEEEGGTWGKVDTTLMVVDDRIGIGGREDGELVARPVQFV